MSDYYTRLLTDVNDLAYIPDITYAAKIERNDKTMLMIGFPAPLSVANMEALESAGFEVEFRDMVGPNFRYEVRRLKRE